MALALPFDCTTWTGSPHLRFKESKIPEGFRCMQGRALSRSSLSSCHRWEPRKYEHFHSLAISKPVMEALYFRSQTVIAHSSSLPVDRRHNNGPNCCGKRLRKTQSFPCVPSPVTQCHSFNRRPQNVIHRAKFANIQEPIPYRCGGENKVGH